MAKPMASLGDEVTPKIEAVIEDQASALMDISGVTGVGQSEVDGEDCILVMVTHSSPEIEAAIPAALGGFRVVVQVVGEFRAQQP